MSMIDAAHSSSSFGSLGRLIADSATTQRQVDRLTNQASTGRIADTYAGLGAGAGSSLNLRPQINALHAWQANIDATATRMKVADTAMGAIQDIAKTLLANLNNLNGLSAISVDAVAANARSALTDVANLLNTQAAGNYVFAGQDTANPPVPNANNITSSGFYTGIATAVAGLATNGATATAAATLTIASSNATGVSPFSAYLSRSVTSIDTPVVQTGPNQTTSIGMLASGNVAVPSLGASSTGSYMRDLMRALATIGSLSSSQMNDPDFNDLVQNTRTSVTGAISAMANDVGVMGDRLAALQDTQTQLGQTEIALSAQLDNAGNVDMAATLSNLSLVRTQLQASAVLNADESQSQFPSGDER